MDPTKDTTPPTDPEFAYSDIHEPTIDELLHTDPNQDSEEAAKPSTVAEEPAAATVPEPSEEPVKQEAPALDPEQLKNEITQSVIAELAADTTKTQDQKDEILEAFLKDHPEPSWQDAFKFMRQAAKADEDRIVEKVKADLQAEVEAEETREAEAKAASEEAQKQTDAAWKSEWDRQYQELETAGKIPPIKNDLDPNDPGVKARADLFKILVDKSKDRQAKGLPALTNLVEIFSLHYVPSTSQPPGADAPIAGAGKSVSSGENEGNFSYSEIHNASVEDVLAKRV
jgi:hypothetical protein